MNLIYVNKISITKTIIKNKLKLLYLAKMLKVD